MKKWLIAAGAVFAVTAVSATAVAQDDIVFMLGDKLYEACKAREVACLKYTEGVSDAMAVAVVTGQRRCLPSGANPAQMADVVRKYLRDHPEKRHLAAMWLVAHALAEAFPCSR